MEESLWFTTRSALFQGGEDSWGEVAAYGAPLSRLIQRRYSWLQPQDREDLVQEILVEIKQRLAPRHDRSRGRFRALLQVVVKRRLLDKIRGHTPDQLSEANRDSLTAPAPDELEALDLESRLIEAVSACRDRFTQGPKRNPDVLYALVDRIVHGHTNVEIAERAGVSPDRVARLLKRGREAIFRHLLQGELALPPGDPRLEIALRSYQETLRSPRQTGRILEDLSDEALRQGLEEFLTRFRSAVARFGAGWGDDEFRRGLHLIFEEPQAKT